MYASFISSIPDVEDVVVGPSAARGIAVGQADVDVQVVGDVPFVGDVQVVGDVQAVVGDQVVKMKLTR